jgi:hypothetical protein
MKAKGQTVEAKANSESASGVAFISGLPFIVRIQKEEWGSKLFKHKFQY